ncbi:MAG: hypothetical protein ACYTHK_20170 [Planctomycetota bacterium]
MNSASLATILSLVALAGVGVVYLKLDSQGEKLDRLLQARSEPRRSIDRGDDSVDAGGWANRAAEGGKVPVSDDKAAHASAEAPQAPMSREDLQQTVSDLRRKVDRMEKDRGSMPIRVRGFPNYARNVKQLASMLKLTKAQAARVEDAVERGKHRVEEILKIPDDTGKSPFERRKELREKMKEASKTGKWQEITAAAMSAHNYRNKTMPGRNETYGEAIKGIRDETRAEISQNLSEEQKKEFEDTRIDSLVSGEGGGAVSFSYVTTSEGPSEDAELVEGGAAIHIVEEDAPEEEKDDE